MLNRRGFFARLAAAGAAILGLKALPAKEVSGASINAIMNQGDRITSIRHLRTWSEEYQCYISRMDVIYEWGRKEALNDLHFYSGDQWGAPSKYGRLTAAQRRFNPARLPA